MEQQEIISLLRYIQSDLVRIRGFEIILMDFIKSFAPDPKIAEYIKLCAKPLEVDYTKMIKIGTEFKKDAEYLVEALEKASKKFSSEQYLLEMKYVGNRLNEIEKILDEIHKNGLKKDVKINISLQGEDLEKIPKLDDATEKALTKKRKRRSFK